MFKIPETDREKIESILYFPQETSFAQHYARGVRDMAPGLQTDREKIESRH